MATEQFANSAQTTLASSISAGATSLTVVSNTAFPTATPFRIQIGSELMMVTGLAGTTWTVEPGLEDTAEAAHGAGAAVTQVLTAGAVTTLIPDQTGNSGKFLTTNGSTTSWGTVSVPLNGWGDGSDGSVTFDGSSTVLGLVPSSNTYTMTRDIWVVDLTVNSGVTLLPAGYRIYCQGTLTNNGTIKNDGAAGVAGHAGGAGTGGASGNTTRTWAGSTSNGAGGAGGRVTNASGAVGSTGTTNTPNTNGMGGGGGAGGSATTSSTSNGGAGATLPGLTSAPACRALPEAIMGIRSDTTSANVLYSCGVGGGGGAARIAAPVGTEACGGGGGGGGGVVVLLAATIANNGTISANGGNGGNGYVNSSNSGAGGGGGGGGGLVVLVYRTFSGTAASAMGGTGGTKAQSGTGTANDGVNGTVGNVVALPS